ncbi:hypothetical protein [Pyrofollis japonicus]|nr:hypothetical protein [Pyrofollis japonicus]
MQRVRFSFAWVFGEGIAGIQCVLAALSALSFGGATISGLGDTLPKLL